LCGLRIVGVTGWYFVLDVIFQVTLLSRPEGVVAVAVDTHAGETADEQVKSAIYRYVAELQGAELGVAVPVPVVGWLV